MTNADQTILTNKESDNFTNENTSNKTNNVENHTSASEVEDNTTFTKKDAQISQKEDEFKVLREELKNTRGKLAELTQISQQALADLQNYKKRTEEEKTKFIIYANTALINDLLQIIDNLDRAMEHMPEDESGKEWANGIEIIFKNLKEILTEHGLEHIPTKNTVFDPTVHEAMMMEEGEKDMIIKEILKGYKLKDKVLRRAKVVVGQGQARTQTQEEVQTQQTQATSQTETVTKTEISSSQEEPISEAETNFNISEPLQNTLHTSDPSAQNSDKTNIS